MSTPIGLGLLLALWLCVLAPVLLRRDEPMRREAAEELQSDVIFSGDPAAEELSAAGLGRPNLGRPSLRRPVAAHATAPGTVFLPASDAPAAPAAQLTELVLPEPDLTELVLSEPALPEPVLAEPAPVGADVAEPIAPASDLETTSVLALVRNNAALLKKPRYFAPQESDDRYEYSDAFYGPADLLYPGAEEIAAAAVDGVVEYDDQGQPHAAADTNTELAAAPAVRITDALRSDRQLPLSAEEAAFARRQAGRGGYDPDADRRRLIAKTKQRQRLVLVLVAAFLVSLAVALPLGGLAWLAPGLCLLLLVGCLVALRRTVVAEERLRQQRINHMRRRRLGVRTIRDEYLDVPERLREPGAVVLEIDDDAPDFVALELATGEEHSPEPGHYDGDDDSTFDPADERYAG